MTSVKSQLQSNQYREQSCCCSKFICPKYLTRIRIRLKRCLPAIAFFGLFKHFLGFVLYIYDIASDALVSKERLEQGNYVWGSVIILLMFLPNVLFLIWMLLGSRRKSKKEEGEQNKLCDKYTGIRVAAGASIQCVTIFSFFLAGFSACFPTRKYFLSIPLDDVSEYEELFQ